MSWPYRNPYPEGTFSHDVEDAARALEDFGGLLAAKAKRVYRWLRLP